MGSMLPLSSQSSLLQAMRHHPCLETGGVSSHGSGLELCQLVEQAWGISELRWWHFLLLDVTECRLGWLWGHFCTATAVLDASLPLCTASCSW